MANVQPTTFKLSLNKVIIFGAIVLIAGFGGGYFLRMKAMESSANLCSAAMSDERNYLNHLKGIIQGGGHITNLQINVYIDLVESRNECLHQQAEWNMTA